MKDEGYENYPLAYDEYNIASYSDVALRVDEFVASRNMRNS